jgi:YgiT-type zinc finger domain-containing protein
MDADRSLPRVHARVDELEETAMNENGRRCPLGGSEKQPGTTTFAVDLTFGVVVVREVPVFVCAQCGDAWITSR